MSTTFVGTGYYGIVLTNPVTQNPSTLAAGSYVTNRTNYYHGDVVYGTNAAAWNFTNFAVIKGTGTLSDGVNFRAGGTVANVGVASISGGFNGVAIYAGTGSVINSGAIRGTGSLAIGVYLTGGGYVSNASSGVITGVYGGIKITSASATIVNSGSISGSTTFYHTGAGDAVYLNAGGAVVTNNAGGRLVGVNNGVEIAAATGRVNNFGSIFGTGSLGAGIFLRATGGFVTNASGGVISALVDGVRISSTSGTVINAGTILGTSTVYATGVGDALFISSGTGLVTNSVGGRLVGVNNGVEISASSGSVNNSGSIAGTGSLGVGVFLRNGGGSVSNSGGGVIAGVFDGVRIGSTSGSASGTVINSGTISGNSTYYHTGVGDGIYISSGSGLVTNNIGGRLSGVNNGVEIATATGTVNNLGSIVGTGSLGAGIFLRAGGGYVINASSGVITALVDGVRIGSALGLAVNSGTISGTSTFYHTGTGDGVYITAYGGGVGNNPGGQLVGFNNGVEINSLVGVVLNSGTVAGNGTVGAGVFLRAAGGYVKNAAGAVIHGVFGGVLIGPTSGSAPGFGTVVNYGAITGYGGSGVGVFLRTGAGFVSNRSGGAIGGVRYGVEITSVTGTVSNSGIISATATGGIGVYLRAGSVTNSGTIAGGTNGTGVYVRYGNVTNSGAGAIIAAGASGTAVSVANGTFFNSGLVQGRVSGIQFTATPGSAPSGRVNVSGSVVGATGITVLSGTASQTLTVAGNVTGTSGTAVSLTKAGSDRLILAPGAAFTGKVDGGSGKSVLEVATSGGAAPAGAADTAAATVYVNFGSVTNFSALQMDPGATANTGGSVSFDTLVNQGQINLVAGDSLAVGTVAAAATGGTIDLKSGGIVHFAGAVAAGQTVLFRPPGGGVVLDHPEQFAASITEFAASDLIDLPLGKASFQQYAGGILSLSYGGGTVALHLATTVTTPQFLLTDDGHGGTNIAVSSTVCFCRGTRVLCERGEVAVEDLQVGERVVTLSGALKPIRWIGMGRDLVTRANRLARPIIVQRGALSDGVPHRDLHLTHGHALYIDGLLIPVEHLVNHKTIRWDESARVVEYYHIELEDHDVLLAEGAPAESYYDAGNRAFFQNARPGSPAGQARPTFAPVLNRGKIVERIWARLFGRAGGRIAIAGTDDPDLHLVVDGVRLDPAAVEDGVFAFALEAAPIETLLLRSRCGVPSLLGQSRRDHRPLGVTIRQIVLHHAGIATRFDYDQPQLREGGCYPPEDGFCWTDGEFALPARFFIGLRGPIALLVCTEPRTGTRYPLAASLAQAA